MGAATGHDKASQIVAIEPWPGKFNGHTYGWVCVPSTSHACTLSAYTLSCTHCLSAIYSTRHTLVSCFPYQPTRLDPRSHAQTNTTLHIRMHICMSQMPAHTHAHTQTHAHIHATYACTCTHTHAHMHIHLLKCMPHTWGVPFVSSAVNMGPAFHTDNRKAMMQCKLKMVAAGLSPSRTNK